MLVKVGLENLDLDNHSLGNLSSDDYSQENPCLENISPENLSPENFIQENLYLLCEFSWENHSLKTTVPKIYSKILGWRLSAW